MDNISLGNEKIGFLTAQVCGYRQVFNKAEQKEEMP